MAIAEKLATWFIFSVVMALIPIGIGVLRQLSVDDPVNIDVLVSQGQLLIITAGLCAKSLGELLTADNASKLSKIVVGGLTLIILLLASLYFADISAQVAKGARLNLEIVRNASLTCYAGAFVSGISCIVLSKV